MKSFYKIRSRETAGLRKKERLELIDKNGKDHYKGISRSDSIHHLDSISSSLNVTRSKLFDS
jgi:hypothetical protein